MLKLIIVAGFYAAVGITFWKLGILKRRYLEPLFLGVLIFGIIALCQPLIFELYSQGFAILMAGTGGYIFVSHMK
jgi:hypothetical protein